MRGRTRNANARWNAREIGSKLGRRVVSCRSSPAPAPCRHPASTTPRTRFSWLELLPSCDGGALSSSEQLVRRREIVGKLRLALDVEVRREQRERALEVRLGHEDEGLRVSGDVHERHRRERLRKRGRVGEGKGEGMGREGKEGGEWVGGQGSREERPAAGGDAPTRQTAESRPTQSEPSAAVTEITRHPHESVAHAALLSVAALAGSALPRSSSADWGEAGRADGRWYEAVRCGVGGGDQVPLQ